MGYTVNAFSNTALVKDLREHTLFVLLTAGTDATDVIPAGLWPESSVFEPDSKRKKLDSGPEAPPE
jgi:hypothetical protein